MDVLAARFERSQAMMDRHTFAMERLTAFLISGQGNGVSRGSGVEVAVSDIAVSSIDGASSSPFDAEQDIWGAVEKRANGARGLPQRLIDSAGRRQSAESAEPELLNGNHLPGWFVGQLPFFGSCGGRGGKLGAIWTVWGGDGPGKAMGQAKGLNLRDHGAPSVKQQERWGSTSNYGRYSRAGVYMENRVRQLQVRVLRVGVECSLEVLASSGWCHSR